MDKVKFKTVDEYVDSFPAPVKTRLKQLRSAIKKAAPKAEEVISYNIAGYKQNGILIYFSGNKKHTGLYPIPAGFEKKVERYASGRSTIKILHTEPLPLKLIADMVKSQVTKNKKASDGKK
jgi:uncharacterized protein YdhG (YjbR/CyaY superfamily)